MQRSGFKKSSLWPSRWFSCSCFELDCNCKNLFVSLWFLPKLNSISSVIRRTSGQNNQTWKRRQSLAKARTVRTWDQPPIVDSFSSAAHLICEIAKTPDQHPLWLKLMENSSKSRPPGSLSAAGCLIYLNITIHKQSPNTALQQPKKQIICHQKRVMKSPNSGLLWSGHQKSIHVFSAQSLAMVRLGTAVESLSTSSAKPWKLDHPYCLGILKPVQSCSCPMLFVQNHPTGFHASCLVFQVHACHNVLDISRSAQQREKVHQSILKSTHVSSQRPGLPW